MTLLAVGNLPAPGPAKVEVSMFSLLTRTMLPGPLALARGLERGTIMGLTKTAREESSLRVAVPTSLIVLLRILAYSKSTESTCERRGVGGWENEGCEMSGKR